MNLPAWLLQPIQQKSLYYLAWYTACVALVVMVTAWAFARQHIALGSLVGWLIASNWLLAAVSWLLARRNRARRVLLALGLLFSSILLLCGFLYISGGHTNPVISLLLLPVALSAVLLSWQPTLLLAGTVIAGYTLLTQLYVPLTADGHHGHMHLMQLHLLGMWITFALSVLLILVLVLPLALAGRRQQQLIARQREKMLEDEKLVTLATFAANAAHKLGTPLSTLAVLTEDMKYALRDQPEWQQDTYLMQQQIALCKQTLHELMGRADKLRNDVREALSIAVLVKQLREQFNLLYPQRSLQVDLQCDDQRTVLADDTLVQALLNLLDNAARVSDDDPLVIVSDLDQQVCMQILDQGPGMPEAIREQIGQPFVSSRPDGLGLGLFLSHATINRLGGTIQLQTTSAGTRFDICLPWYEEV
jgi:two-component system sensor histidine kinase RegB